MAGSSRDHERGAHLPDELSDILRSLSERQTNILYHALTNQHVADISLTCCRTESQRSLRITLAQQQDIHPNPTVLSKPNAEATSSSFEDYYSSCSLQTSEFQCHVAPQRCELHRSTSATAATINHLLLKPTLSLALVALLSKRFVQRLLLLLRFLMSFHLATPTPEIEAVPVADLRQLKHCLEETHWL